MARCDTCHLDFTVDMRSLRPLILSAERILDQDQAGKLGEWQCTCIHPRTGFGTWGQNGDQTNLHQVSPRPPHAFLIHRVKPNADLRLFPCPYIRPILDGGPTTHPHSGTDETSPTLFSPTLGPLTPLQPPQHLLLFLLPLLPHGFATG